MFFVAARSQITSKQYTRTFGRSVTEVSHLETVARVVTAAVILQPVCDDTDADPHGDTTQLQDFYSLLQSPDISEKTEANLSSKLCNWNSNTCPCLHLDTVEGTG